MSTDSARFLVTGATGHLGGLVAASLLQHGHRVRLLTRGRARPAAASAPGVELVTGEDPAALHTALDGVPAVFLVCGETPDRPRFETTFIDAAAAHGVRVVKLSAIGAAPDAPTFLRWHHIAEEHLRGSGAEWAILRPNSFMDNLLRNDRHSISAGQWRSTLGTAGVSLLAGTDLAEVATTVLTGGNAHSGQVYELTGPDTLTAPRIAACLEQVLGHPVAVIDTTPDQLEQGLRHRGAPEFLARGVAELHAQFRTGQAAAVTDTVARILQRPAATLIDYLTVHRDAFARSDAGDAPTRRSA